MTEYWTGTSGDDYNNYLGSDKLFAKGLGGNDYIWGNSGNDTLYGGDGNDTLRGYYGNDLLYGEKGNDSLEGEVGNDYLNGGTGDDSLYGGDGNDTLIGGSGLNTLEGGSGNDLLDARSGFNTLTGDSGSDVFYLSTTSYGHITDFEDGVDRIKGLDFNSVDIYQFGNNTIITDSTRTIAYGMLADIDASLITAADFIA